METSYLLRSPKNADRLLAALESVSDVASKEQEPRKP